MRHPSLIQRLPDMATFVRVAELGSFSAAAAELGLTPSAVSRQIGRLERALSVRLVLRNTRQLRLSEAGVQVFGHCAQIVASAQATLALAQSFSQGPQGCVRLSAPLAFARHRLQVPLLGFLRAYPEVDVQLMVSDQELDPLREPIDLAVRLTEAPPPGLVARELMPVQEWLVASPAYLRRHRPIRQPLDLRDHSCLGRGEREVAEPWRLRRHREQVDVITRGRLRVNHSELRLLAACDGLGVARVPDYVALPAIGQGQVVRVLPEWQFAGGRQGRAYVVYAPDRFLPAKCRALIDYLAATMQHPDSGAAQP